MTIPFQLVGVFGDQPFAGNPAAVFLDAHDIPEAKLRPLAFSIGRTGSVFVFPPSRPGPIARLRTFVGDVELAFLAHTTLAAVHALDEAKPVSASDGGVVEIETNDGVLRVRVERRQGRVRTLALALPEVELETHAADLSVLLKSAGLTQDDLHATAPIEKAGPYLLVPLRNGDGLRRITPDDRGLVGYGTTFGVHAFAFFAIETAQPRRLASRVLAPALLSEDPATGSVHAALARYLAKHDLFEWTDPGAGSYEVVQGDRFGRSGRLDVRFQRAAQSASKVEVSGMSCTWIEGSLET